MQTSPIESDAETLRDECRLFARYLLDEEPDDYVLEQYVALHGKILGDAMQQSGLDDVLLRTGRSGVLGLSCADAHARIFRPRTMLREKLILAFAIFENSRQFHARFTSGSDLSKPIALIRIALSLLRFSAAFLASLVLITPRGIVASRTRERDGQ